MDVTPLIAPGQKVIQGYGKGFFRINGELYNRPVIVFPDDVLVWDVHVTVEHLVEKDFLQVMDCAPEILLLGCGVRFCLVPSALKQGFKGTGISLDSMDTGAACRTYNVLMAEGRSVAAALLPV